MIVLDAYALVAVFAAEPAEDEVTELLRQGDCAMSTLNLAEAADVLARTQGIDTSLTRSAVETLVATNALTVVDVDERRAWRAAQLRARHYDRREATVSLADCVLLATARPGVDSVATPDPPVVGVARAEGVGVVPLPNSTGTRPT
jgi:PIN domain nuclease of toxin-antitoxin system